MQYTLIRQGLYLERLLVAFASGIFLMLPLYFRSTGHSEIFFGQVYAAGAIGTLVCVTFSAALIRRFGLARIAPVGSLLYAAGSFVYYVACSGFFSSSVAYYYAASLLQGAGWGLVFTLGPICLSTTVDDKNRSYHFTVYAAFSTLGVGAAPLVTKLITHLLPVTQPMLFLAAGALSLAATAISEYVARHNTTYGSAQPAGTVSGIGEFVMILRQPSVYFFGMVLLGACIYTAMMNLQTTFADSQGIDYAVFYGFYSLAVVLSRFFISKPLSRTRPGRAIFWLMILMLIALGLLFGAERSLLCYAAGALLLGVSYGLVYPIIQAQATNHAPIHLRAQTLVYFSLSYFVAVYLFPYPGAWIAVHHGYHMLLGILVTAAVLELGLALVFYLGLARRQNALAANK